MYEGLLKSSWTGGSAPLLCKMRHNSKTAAHCHQSTNFPNGPSILGKRWEGVGWMHLAQDRDQWRAVGEHCNEISGSIKGAEFLD